MSRALPALEFAAQDRALGAQLRLARIYGSPDSAHRNDAKALHYLHLVAKDHGDIDRLHPAARHVSEAFRICRAITAKACPQKSASAQRIQGRSTAAPCRELFPDRRRRNSRSGACTPRGRRNPQSGTRRKLAAEGEPETLRAGASLSRRNAVGSRCERGDARPRAGLPDALAVGQCGDPWRGAIATALSRQDRSATPTRRRSDGRSAFVAAWNQLRGEAFAADSDRKAEGAAFKTAAMIAAGRQLSCFRR